MLRSLSFGIGAVRCSLLQRTAPFYLILDGEISGGIICRPKTSPYPFTWVKVKNPNYSQAVGRGEWFERLQPRFALFDQTFQADAATRQCILSILEPFVGIRDFLEQLFFCGSRPGGGIPGGGVEGRRKLPSR